MQKFSLQRSNLRGCEPVGKHGSLNAYAGFRTNGGSDMRFGIFKKWFLEEEHTPVTCKPAHQMLRSLEHETPTKMGKTDQIDFVRYHWNPSYLPRTLSAIGKLHRQAAGKALYAQSNQHSQTARSSNDGRHPNQDDSKWDTSKYHVREYPGCGLLVLQLRRNQTRLLAHRPHGLFLTRQSGDGSVSKSLAEFG